MKKTLIAATVALLATGFAHASTEADVENTFNPYKGGFPKVNGLNPGTVINKANADQFKDAIPAGVYKLLKDGLFEIKVGPTTQFELSKPYVEATRKNLGKAKLGAKNGDLEGYVAGRPFPEEPDAKDPRAGEKLAWNYKYGVNWGDGAAIYPFYWKYRNMQTGQVEKTLKMNMHFLNFKHRVKDAPLPEVTPNPSELFRAIYVKVLEPQDLKNTQLLIQRYEDDQKLDDAYLYLGFQRRVRRLATGQTTDAFLGSDLMIEDFEGYNGRVLDAEWKYVDTKSMLMPVYRHSQLKNTAPKDADGYGMVTFHGQGECFPNIPWSLRTVHVLEAVPTLSSSPIGKRIMYLDAQATVFPMILIYDKKGELWKRWQVGYSDSAYHAPVNKDAGIMIYTTASMLDVQSKHCTALALKMQSEPKANPPSMFSVQYLRGGD